MTLNKLNNRTYYIPGTTNIGVYMLSEKDCVLIDTTFYGKPAVKLLNIIKNKDLNVRYIIHTHGHIDHIGADDLLSQHYSFKIYATPYEKTFIRYPNLTQSFLTSSKPLPTLNVDLRGLIADEIKGSTLEIEHNNINIIKLPGHSREHIGIMTPDGILFAGDAIISPDLIDNIKIPYLYDVNKFNKSLYKIKKLSSTKKVEKVVPGHGKVIANSFTHIVDMNLNKIEKLMNLLLNILKKKPLTLEKIIKQFNKKLGINNKVSSHFITKSCLMSFLIYFMEKNRVETIFKENLLYYRLV